MVASPGKRRGASMRKLLLIVAALSGSSAFAMSDGAEPQIVLMDPAFSDGPAVIIPAGSALRVSFPPDPDHNAAFTGSLTLTGTYELQGYGEDASVMLWLDSPSLAAMPQWRGRWEGGPTHLYIHNGWDFAQAAVPKSELEKLKADDQHRVRGQITVVVDDYETAVECDRAHYSARFVSIVNPTVQMAAVPIDEETGGC